MVSPTSIVGSDFIGQLNGFLLSVRSLLPARKMVSRKEFLEAVRATQEIFTFKPFGQYYLDSVSPYFREAWLPLATDELNTKPTLISALDQCVETMNDQQASLREILVACKRYYRLIRGKDFNPIAHCGKVLAFPMKSSSPTRTNRRSAQTSSPRALKYGQTLTR